VANPDPAGVETCILVLHTVRRGSRLSERAHCEYVRMLVQLLGLLRRGSASRRTGNDAE
jgi:hypothetical protein